MESWILPGISNRTSDLSHHWFKQGILGQCQCLAGILGLLRKSQSHFQRRCSHAPKPFLNGQKFKKPKKTKGQGYTMGILLPSRHQKPSIKVQSILAKRCGASFPFLSRCRSSAKRKKARGQGRDVFPNPALRDRQEHLVSGEKWKKTKNLPKRYLSPLWKATASWSKLSAKASNKIRVVLNCVTPQKQRDKKLLISMEHFFFNN